MNAPDAVTRLAIKNILFATDFSLAAAKALPYAAEFARRDNAKVSVMHVSSIHGYPFQLPETWPQMAEAEELLRERAVQEIGKALAGIPHEMIFQEGPVWNALSRVIDQRRIDLLVLGTHGRTGIEKALMGSIAEEVFRHATCPVLTVGSCICPSPRRPLAIQRILYATDFSQESLAAAPYALSLAQENHGVLTLLHCTQRSDDIDRLLDALRELVPAGIELSRPPHCLVQLSAPSNGILGVSEAQSADLIVLGVHQANWAQKATAHFLDSTAYKVATRAGCPVLTVRG